MFLFNAPAATEISTLSLHDALPISGASFGFARQALADLGGFDTALGAGTATGGGEDLDIFVRVLRSGGAIAYEPSALVWHQDRKSTRLNSSHSSISYAVFCLKKKID